VILVICSNCKKSKLITFSQLYSKVQELTEIGLNKAGIPKEEFRLCRNCGTRFQVRKGKVTEIETLSINKGTNKVNPPTVFSGIRRRISTFIFS
jgi:hypothetical protein